MTAHPFVSTPDNGSCSSCGHMRTNDIHNYSDQIPDQVVCFRYGGQPVWRIFVGGKLIAAEWTQPGPAQAAIEVERARQKKKALLRVGNTV